MQRSLYFGTLTVLLASGAGAQSPIAAPNPAESDEAPAALQRIEVTATKRPADVRDIVGSVSAETGRSLERSGAQGLDEFIKLTPGVQILQEGHDLQKMSIRGLSSSSQFVTQTTGIFIGEAAFTDPYYPRVSPDVNPFDLSTVEILKGPQGTLFGGSALNGAIRYTPVKARLGQTEFKYFAQFDQIDQGGGGLTVGTAANLPLGTTAAIRLTALDRKIPGYVDNTAAGTADANHGTQRAYRLQATWQPADRLTFEALYWKQSTQMAGLPWVDNLDGRLIDASQLTNGKSDTDFDLATVSARYAFDSFDLLATASRTSKTADQRVDNSVSTFLLGLPDARLNTLVNTTIKGTAQELRVVSRNDSPLKWLGGLYRQTSQVHELGDNRLYEAYGGLPADTSLLSFPADIKATETALFGELGWRTTPALELIAGGRYHRNTVSGRIDVTIAPDVLSNAGRVSETQFDPKLGLRYDLGPSVQLWALASKGYRFGGLNTPTAPGVPSTYKSDHLKSYEAGIRTEWPASGLQADLTLYTIDWKNPQTYTDDPSGFFAYVENVGKVHGKGAEVSVRFAPPTLKGLSVRAAGAYNDLKTATPFTVPGSSVAPVGTRWPAATRWQSSAQVNYETRLGEWRGGVTGTYAYTGPAPSDLLNTFTLYGYETFDLMFNLRPAGRSAWPEIGVGVMNLKNVHAPVSAQAAAPGLTDRVFYNPPRTLTLRLSGQF